MSRASWNVTSPSASAEGGHGHRQMTPMAMPRAGYFQRAR